jgi:hypothetical protein
VPNALGTDHDVPAQTACIQCHQGEPSAVLGVSAVQLSRSGFLDELARDGLLSVDPERRFPIPGTEIQTAAIGYLNANCGHCHSAEGVADIMRLRFLPTESDLPIEQTEIYKTTIRKKITDWKIHPDDLQQRVVPGDPEHSGLLYRMLQRGPDLPGADDAMPPIATEHIHHEGVAAVEAWIATMPPDLDLSLGDADENSPPLPAKKRSRPASEAAGHEAPDHASEMMVGAEAGRKADSKPRAEGGRGGSNPSGDTKMAENGGSGANPGTTTDASAGEQGQAESAGAPAAPSGGAGGLAAGSGGAGAGAAVSGEGGSGGAAAAGSGGAATGSAGSGEGGAGGAATDSGGAGAGAAGSGEGGMGGAAAGAGGAGADAAGSGE